MNNSQNPFIYGPPVPPEKFIGRETEVDHILGRLANPNNRGGSMVSGPSGIGKTSLLHYLFAKETRRRWAGLGSDVAHFIYIPMQLIVPYSEIGFWEYVFEELEDWLGPVSGIQRIANALKSGIVPTRFTFSRFFTTLGDSNKFVIVLLDGFDLLIGEITKDNSEAGMGFLHSLQALLILPAPRGFSLITSSERDLYDLFKDVPWFGSPFCSTMAHLPLGAFDETEIDKLISSYLAGTGIDFDKNERGLLKKDSRGHPRKLQHAAYLLFEKKLHTRQRTAVGKGDNKEMTLDPKLVNIITGASVLLIEIARDVFKARKAYRQTEEPTRVSGEKEKSSASLMKTPALPIDEPDELRTVLQQIDLAGKKTTIDTIESLVKQLTQHKRNWNDYLEEEAKPTASTVARVEARQLKENEEILIKSKSLSLREQLEELTGYTIELPGLE